MPTARELMAQWDNDADTMGVAATVTWCEQARELIEAQDTRIRELETPSRS